MPLISTTPYLFVPTEFTLIKAGGGPDANIITTFTETYHGFYMSTDGLRMFAITTIGSLGPGGSSDPSWDHVHASTSGTPYSTNWSAWGYRLYRPGTDPTIRGLEFKPDGTKMYVTRDTGTVREYTLSAAWSLSDFSNFQDFSAGSPEIQFTDLYLKSDGMTLLTIGGGRIYEFSMSTPWDVSTASYVQDVAVPGSSGSYFDVKADGTKMYFKEGNRSMYEYDFGTAWDITTLSLIRSVIDTYTHGSGGFQISSDGTRLFMVGGAPASGSYTFRYNLT